MGLEVGLLGASGTVWNMLSPKREESGVFICQLLQLSGCKGLKLTAGTGWKNKHCPVALSALR